MPNPIIPAQASSPISPPLLKFPIGTTDDNKPVMPTLQFLKQWQVMWASVSGTGGTQGQLDIIFGMHGDGTLTDLGVLTVTKTNGVAFGYFATGTDAANLTGTLAPARIADDSLPYAKLVDTASGALLGASSAGPVVGMTAGRGISLAGSAVTAQDPITVVASLGTATAGLRAFVTDSTVAASGNFGSIVAGTGGNFVPVFADGANWLIG